MWIAWAAQPEGLLVVSLWVTHVSGPRPFAATANVTVDLVQNLLEGREVVVSGQVQLDGEFYGLRKPLGVPIVRNASRLDQVVPLQLWAEEADLSAEKWQLS